MRAKSEIRTPRSASSASRDRSVRLLQAPRDSSRRPRGCVRRGDALRTCRPRSATPSGRGRATGSVPCAASAAATSTDVVRARPGSAPAGSRGCPPRRSPRRPSRGRPRRGARTSSSPRLTSWPARRGSSIAPSGSTNPGRVTYPASPSRSTWARRACSSGPVPARVSVASGCVLPELREPVHEEGQSLLGSQPRERQDPQSRCSRLPRRHVDPVGDDGHGDARVPLVPHRLGRRAADGDGAHRSDGSGPRGLQPSPAPCSPSGGRRRRRGRCRARW